MRKENVYVKMLDYVIETARKFHFCTIHSGIQLDIEIHDGRG